MSRGVASTAGRRSLRRRFTALFVGPATFALLLCSAPAAMAADSIYWNNYTGGTVAYANLDGSGGGPLNTTGASVDEPEAMAIDTATGRLFWTSPGAESSGRIFFANLDGSGGGQLDTGAAPSKSPYGLAIDPTTRTLYWTNAAEGLGGEATIGYARLDGSGAGLLNVGTAPLADPYILAIDTAARRIYWPNTSGEEQIAYANLDGGGGGVLDTSGATPPTGPRGLSIDVAAGRIYWIDETIASYASLAGGGGGDLNTGAANFNDPFGLALDPTAGRLYWGNYGNGTNPLGAFAYANLPGGGSGGSIDIATAPVDGPQHPVILKAPSGVSAPQVSFNRARGVLSCTQGAWAPDQAGASFYQAPQTTTYQWSRNGAQIAGATANTYKPRAAGSHTCSVTASNHAGATTQTSGPRRIKAAKVKLVAQSRKRRTKPGKAATFRVKLRNTGDLVSSKARLCTRAPKKAKKAVRAPKCRRFSRIAPGRSRTLRLRVKAKRPAAGTYRLRFIVRGTKATKPAAARLIVKPKRG
ncbi:MAG TPA: hypothetical protein VFZ41_09145 [Solirubrobacterales bacterium]